MPTRRGRGVALMMRSPRRGGGYVGGGAANGEGGEARRSQAQREERTRRGAPLVLAGAIAGCCGFAAGVGGWWGFAACFVIRALGLHYGWSLPVYRARAGRRGRGWRGWKGVESSLHRSLHRIESVQLNVA